jgi:acyl-CoA thioester hydrolase
MMKNNEPNPLAFSLPVRVYYEDTDAGGVVYYANYLKFFERCRSEWVRSLGYDQSQLTQSHGIIFVVRSVSVEYLRPARLEDLLTIRLEVEELGRSRIILRQSAHRGEEALATGVVQIVCVACEPMKATPIPKMLRQQLEACL